MTLKSAMKFKAGRKITFEEICEVSTKIEMLYSVASMIGKKRGKTFCRTRVFLTAFKPIIYQHVGWGREENRLKYEEWAARHPEVKSQGLPSKAELIVLNDWDDPAPTHFPFIDWMETGDAYDVAYDTILNALPLCNHEGPICW